MVALGEIHFRVGYLLVAVGVLALLRRPVANPDRPGSRWLALTILALSLALGGVGLYYFVPGRTGSVVLWTLVMFATSLCFIGWLLIAVEFATGRSAPRVLVVGLGTLVVLHLGALVTNLLGVHELVFRATTTVDATGSLQREAGPLFQVQVVVVYLLAGVSTALYVSEWANSTGLRRRQAGILSLALVPAFVLSVPWFTDTVAYPFDPTPVGGAVGILVLTWGLYREEFLDIVPVGRETVVGEMRDAVVIVDTDDRVVDWNRAAQALFDPADPRVGMPASAFFDPVSADALPTPADGPTESELTLDRNGDTRHVTVTVSRVERDDRTLGRALVARDTTARTHRERQLVAQNERLEEFASIVSHDLQGPLMEIRGSADLAVRTGDTDHVADVLDATDRMDDLVETLLDLARAGTRVDEREQVTLGTEARAAWQQVWTADATLVVEQDRTLRADPDRFRQLLENLVTNAIEHNTPDPERGPVEHASDGGEDAALTLTVGALDDGFYLADDGRGIPPDERERVFERGYTTASDGTGLGLGIVRQVARAHGWSIRVTEADDGGARFEITGLDADP
jgi:signal transduction histidine kinase